MGEATIILSSWEEGDTTPSWIRKVRQHSYLDIHVFYYIIRCITLTLSPSLTDHNITAQLEAVKFLCKEFWTEVFRKQIDKLQTNHRGVFVLKDQELKWLRRLPADEESARVGAIRILAFPCGLIRGALACLGLSGAIVSCDFLADGKTMASCSFNIKVK